MKRLQEAFLLYEFKEAICADRYEVTDLRQDRRNGYRYRGLNTGFGYIEGIKVPRGRKGGYSFSLFKRYKRRSEEFDNIVLYAVLCGMSNRRVRQFFETFYESKLSEATISNVVAQLDEELKQFRTFPIAINYPYLIIDGLSVSILSGGIQEEKVVIFAMGLDNSGKADLLAFMLVDSESEVAYQALFNDLYRRGLKNIELLIHDGSKGIVAAANWVYPYARHQRCIFHKQMNLLHNIRRQFHKKAIIEDSQAIYEANTKREALIRANRFKRRWIAKEPYAIKNFFKDFEATLTYFDFPKSIREAIKTTNYLERYFEEIRRRIKLIGCFRNQKSCERYIYGLIKITYKNLKDVVKQC